MLEQQINNTGGPHPLRILVLDDDSSTVAVLARVLGQKGWDVVTALNMRDAQSHMNQVVPDVAVVDVYLGDDDGLEFVKKLRSVQADLGIIVISAEDTETLAKKALASGADYFLSKPIMPSALLLTVQKLSELRSERQRTKSLTRELERSIRDSAFPEIVTHADSMRGVLRLIEKVAPRDLSVLICGESGTGKELIARAIHQSGKRPSGPFVELNCAALPPNLVESELFGHEKGAFTGAIASRAGKIELANDGTLFLDEIGELSLDMQPKLLRALQERRITRVGGKKDIPCDFRLVCATNRDLVAEVREGRFREDLYYRVAVFPIKLPPLRERPEDLDLLLAHFLKSEGMRAPRITPEARDTMHEYHWPGNVRELKNFAQAVPLLVDNETIDEEAVRTYFGSRLQDGIGAFATSPMRSPRGGMAPASPVGNETMRPVVKLEDIERAEIRYALSYYRGGVPEAAMALGIGRATLYKYIRKEGISLTEFTGEG